MPSASPETTTHRPSAAATVAEEARETVKHPNQSQGGEETVLLSPEDIHPALIAPTAPRPPRPRKGVRRSTTTEEQGFAEAIFFDYGVVVFFGLREDQELNILEDVEAGGNMSRKIPHDDWEVEACHYAVRSLLLRVCIIAAHSTARPARPEYCVPAYIQRLLQ